MISLPWWCKQELLCRNYNQLTGSSHSLMLNFRIWLHDCKLNGTNTLWIMRQWRLNGRLSLLWNLQNSIIFDKWKEGQRFYSNRSCNDCITNGVSYYSILLNCRAGHWQQKSEWQPTATTHNHHQQPRTNSKTLWATPDNKQTSTTNKPKKLPPKTTRENYMQQSKPVTTMESQQHTGTEKT